MTGHRHSLADLFAACWKDAALKHRFMADPKAVLAEYGMGVPDGMDVNVVENTDTTVHISLPAPPSGHEDLSDDDLSNAAGGLDGVGGFGGEGGNGGRVD
ncbi:MAG: NHLP leader peptide family natural product precursor [Planctomycetaceae bacterium]|nr:NHLP leader peptide family natural product precursor [Planctomycetaceae bacterium]